MSEVLPFTQNPQVRKEMIRLLELTLEEVKEGKVEGLTIIISRPPNCELYCFRDAYERRIPHIGALTLAIHNMCK